MNDSIINETLKNFAIDLNRLIFESIFHSFSELIKAIWLYPVTRTLIISLIISGIIGCIISNATYGLSRLSGKSVRSSKKAARLLSGIYDLFGSLSDLFKK
ncbi:hypothetical protein [Anaerocolumna chitinilytica]|uniref:Uncharacterized protein n=1 Tax=Anaerocolumna chitinilytica TaxID=1727145 RepID=A0A7I8DI36_9FIRM|nr:hypothetical protein [Anaerocolumna chitinilytica]BCJ98089.1 hypothetical protein bsdcttw_11300 [Anaerocolumna chitinilytica]